LQGPHLIADIERGTLKAEVEARGARTVRWAGVGALGLAPVQGCGCERCACAFVCACVCVAVVCVCKHVCVRVAACCPSCIKCRPPLYAVLLCAWCTVFQWSNTIHTDKNTHPHTHKSLPHTCTQTCTHTRTPHMYTHTYTTSTLACSPHGSR
jgi:hypothetical protein